MTRLPLDTLGRLFEEQFEQEHRCERNHDIVRILKTTPNPQSASWWFVVVALADQEAVDHGEADEVGEVMSAHMDAIAFCPFCGVELPE